MNTSMTRRGFNRNMTMVAGAALASPAIVRAQPRKLKVGVVLPLSSYLAKLGQSCKMGADIAPGVLREMLGVDIELMTADFESKVEEARAKSEKLIDEGAQILVGAFDSGATAAIAQVAEQRKVPFVVNISSAPQITEQGYQYTFRNFPHAIELTHNGLALLRDLFQATGTAPRTAAFMHTNDTFGTSSAKAINTILPKLDYLPFKVVETVSYDPTARDLSVEVAKAKASNADIVLMVCRLNDAIAVTREMVKQRYNPMGLISPGSPGLYEQSYFTTLGKYSEFAISNVPWYDQKADMTRLVDAAMKKQFPNEQLQFHALNVGFTFEALLVAADAFKRAGTGDGPALADALRKTRIDDHMMLGGPIQFDAKGHNVGIISAGIQNRDRQPVVVLPAGKALKQAVFPVPEWTKRT